MKLEYSTTWNTERPAWRVVSRAFHWGPWCYSRRDAWWEWLKSFDTRRRGCSKDEFGMKWFVFILPCVMAVVCWGVFKIPFVRADRWLQNRCLVCGVSVATSGLRSSRYRYCSLECAAYDGALKDQSKSWVLFGTLKLPKKHFESQE